MVLRSDPPLPEVHRPSHMMPSAHLWPHDVSPDLDPTVSETLSSSDSDDRVTLADLVKGKTSCPKKPRTTVRKRRISSEVR